MLITLRKFPSLTSNFFLHLYFIPSSSIFDPSTLYHLSMTFDLFLFFPITLSSIIRSEESKCPGRNHGGGNKLWVFISCLFFPLSIVSSHLPSSRHLSIFFVYLKLPPSEHLTADLSQRCALLTSILFLISSSYRLFVPLLIPSFPFLFLHLYLSLFILSFLPSFPFLSIFFILFPS